jgi:hypothetical protein
VNIGRERPGKFLRPMRQPDAAGRLDVHGGRWQYSPPRLPGANHSTPNQASDLHDCVNSAIVASLSRTL